MHLQQLQQQVRELAPAIAYVVAQGNPYSANSYSLTMDGLRGVLLAGATAEAVLEFVQDAEFLRRFPATQAVSGTVTVSNQPTSIEVFGQGESVQSITQGD
jgi:hypothetical protein